MAIRAHTHREHTSSDRFAIDMPNPHTHTHVLCVVNVYLVREQSPPHTHHTTRTPKPTPPHTCKGATRGAVTGGVTTAATAGDKGYAMHAMLNSMDTRTDRRTASPSSICQHGVDLPSPALTPPPLPSPPPPPPYQGGGGGGHSDGADTGNGDGKVRGGRGRGHTMHQKSQIHCFQPDLLPLQLFVQHVSGE